MLHPRNSGCQWLSDLATAFVYFHFLYSLFLILIYYCLPYILYLPLPFLVPIFTLPCNACEYFTRLLEHYVFAASRMLRNFCCTFCKAFTRMSIEFERRKRDRLTIQTKWKLSGWWYTVVQCICTSLSGASFLQYRYEWEWSKAASLG